MRNPDDIKVLVDTNIVDSNTADSLAVQLSFDNPVIGQINLDGKIIKGDNLVVTDIQITRQGDLKQRIIDLTNQLSEIQQQLKDTQSLLDLVQPKVDEAISSILLNNPQ